MQSPDGCRCRPIIVAQHHISLSGMLNLTANTDSLGDMMINVHICNCHN